MQFWKTSYGLGLAQVLSVVLCLSFYHYVWPAPPFARQHFINASTPFLIWIPPLVVYVVGRMARPLRQRWLGVVAALGSIGIVAAYGFLLHWLSRWETRQALEQFEQCRQSAARSCFGRAILDPPPPPQHWPWAVAAYAAVTITLYLALFFIERRTLRPQANVDQLPAV